MPGIGTAARSSSMPSPPAWRSSTLLHCTRTQRPPPKTLQSGATWFPNMPSGSQWKDVAVANSTTGIFRSRTCAINGSWEEVEVGVGGLACEGGRVERRTGGSWPRSRKGASGAKAAQQGCWCRSCTPQCTLQQRAPQCTLQRCTPQSTPHQRFHARPNTCPIPDPNARPNACPIACPNAHPNKRFDARLNDPMHAPTHRIRPGSDKLVCTQDLASIVDNAAANSNVKKVALASNAAIVCAIVTNDGLACCEWRGKRAPSPSCGAACATGGAGTMAWHMCARAHAGKERGAMHPWPPCAPPPPTTPLPAVSGGALRSQTT